MAVFPIVKGTRLRATRINSCGLPVAGAANYLVTSGFVQASISAVMKDAEELEQTNAEGKVCVTERTPPERKYYNVELELCNVNTGLISLFNGWEQVLDANDLPIGFRDQESVEADFGVALEIWTGGKGEDDCPVPTADDVFAATSSGKKYGYLLIGATEFTLGDIQIGAQVSTLTLTGRSIAMPQWGKGPWNVQANDTGDAVRLLEPLNEKSHFTMFRTPIAPPEPTPGSEPCPLEIATLFTGTSYYFGGPAGAAAIDVAPDQPACDGTAVVGAQGAAPSGGNGGDTGATGG